MAAAANEFGKSLAQAGEVLFKLQEQQDEYETRKKLIEFKRATEQKYQEYQREITPGGDGFQAGWDQIYKKDADKFFGQQGANFPQRQRQRVDLELVGHHERLSTNAQSYELLERDRFAKEDLTNTLGGLQKDVEGAPGRLQEKHAEGLALIDNSRLRAPDKYTVRKKFKSELDKAAALSEVLGAATGDDFRNVEQKLFVSVPSKPQARDRTGSDFLRPAPKGGSRGGLYEAKGLDIEMGIDEAAPYMARPRDERSIKRIVVHGDVQEDADKLVKYGRQVDKARGFDPNYHFYVHRDGRIVQGVPLDRKAFHARDANDDSIGIVFAGADGGKMPTPEQELAGKALISSLGEAYGIKPANVVGHGELQPGHRDTREGGNIASDIRKHGFGVPTQVARAEAGLDGPPEIKPLEKRGITSYAGLGKKGEGAPEGEPGARLPGTPKPIWVSEEEGSASYAGPYQNLSLAERKAVWSQLETRRKAIAAGISKEIQDWEKVAVSGFALPDAMLADLQERVEQAGDRTLTAHFNSTLALGDITRKLNAARPTEIESYLKNTRTSMMKNGATAVGLKHLEHAEKVLTSMRAAINDDPLSYASKVGLVTHQPIDLSKPETLEKRAETARAVGNYYGQAPVFFTKDERNALTDVVRQGGEPMLKTLAAIGQSFGPDTRAAVAEFAKDAPEAAYIGTMMLDAERNNGANVKAIKDAAETIEARRDKNYKKLLTENADYKSTVTEALGSAFRELKDSHAGIIATADAVYEARARRRGNVTAFDPDLWKQGLKEVLGESTANNATYGGILHQNTFNWFGFGSNNPIVIPPNIKKDGFRDLIQTIRHEDLYSSAGYGGVETSVVGPVTGDRRPLPLADIRRANLVTVGPGQYWLSMGDPDGGDPQWIKDVSGKNYVLDMHALEPLLKKRRPDLYLGYLQPVADVPMPPTAP